jgi:hypothetical protein
MTRNRELTLLVTAGILFVFAVVDYQTPAIDMSGKDWRAFIAVGICIAQVTLIVAWAVFAPGNIVVRLPWSLLLGLAMWYLLVFGRRQADRMPMRPEEVFTLGVALLLGVTVLQIPLWIAKRVFRFRMFVSDDAPLSVERGPVQFQLKHLLIGTFIFAVALSPIRLILPKESAGNLFHDQELLVLVPAAVVVNLVATLPCLWGGFLPGDRAWRLGLAWLGYGFLVTVIEFAVVCAILGAPGGENVLLKIYLLNFTQGTVVFVVMRIYRTLGFRMQRVPAVAMQGEMTRASPANLTSGSGSK